MLVTSKNFHLDFHFDLIPIKKEVNLPVGLGQQQ